MATTRVYILAKELGVKSAAIITKCQDEGLDIKNHMSVISAGLGETIKEWFSEGTNVTTVETSKKVDLKKVRVAKKAKPRKSEKTKKEEAAAGEEEPQPDETDEATKKDDDVKVKKTKKEKAVEEIVDGETAEELPPQPAVKVKPKPIVPAGRILKKPAPAKLSGPKIVRIEKPEPQHQLRPKPRTRYNAPVTEPLIKNKELGKTSDTVKKGSPKRNKERTHGRRKDSGKEGTPEKSKFETLRREKDLEERRARLKAADGQNLRLRPRRKLATSSHAENAYAAVRPEKATISEPITVKNLSATLAVKVGEIISKLMQQGVMATANQVLACDAAELVALEFGTELTIEHKKTLEDEIRQEFEERQKNHLKKRSVIATMLGHVDHGKTSLLDKIRSAHITDGEAGGITQHVGAYQVKWAEKSVTFLDTPGHKAFTAMRARGANMTDIVVLVVAADDGLMPQTIEAINHAKAGNVPVIVALNKTDLPGYDINRIYAQLAEHELNPVEWGGETEVVKTSAVTGDGIDDLLEHLDYAAELLDLKADDTISATGWVVEAKMSAQRGAVATLLIKEGKLSKTDIVLAGDTYGRIKILRDSSGKNIKTATSAMPVEITGLNQPPKAGDKFYCLKDINRAKQAAEENQARSRENALAKRTQVTLDNLFSQIEAGNVKELNVIIRADVQGSVDVLRKYLTDLSTDEVKIKILHAAPGGITEGDCLLAEASNAIIIGFNVVSEEHVSKIAESRGVDIRLYTIIYRITEDLEKSMTGLLDPEEKENNVGKATVKTTFKVSKIGTIAGCYVNDGLATKKSKVRLIRDSVIIRDGLVIDSLKHFKDDVRQVKAGLECGIKIAKFDDVKVDDVFDFYEIVKVARTL